MDNSRRDLHGALLDVRILVDVYLAMTGGQAALTLDGDPETADVRGRQSAGSAAPCGSP